MCMKVMGLGVFPVASPVLWAGRPSKKLLHAVKHAVVSV